MSYPCPIHFNKRGLGPKTVLKITDVCLVVKWLFIDNMCHIHLYSGQPSSIENHMAVVLNRLNSFQNPL